MIPSAVVPFKSGDFLVTGMETSGKEPAPLTAIFDSSGKLLKRVTLPEEKVDNQALEPVSSEVKDSRSSVSLSWGAGSPSSDGNAYILSGTSPATVYIISPGGEVTRKLKVDPGDSEEVGFWIQESEGQLAVLFTKANQPGQIIKVLNSGTGKTVANYNPGPLGVGLGCFEAPDQFTFAAHRAGKLVLVRAQPAKD